MAEPSPPSSGAPYQPYPPVDPYAPVDPWSDPTAPYRETAPTKRLPPASAPPSSAQPSSAGPASARPASAQPTSFQPSSGLPVPVASSGALVPAADWAGYGAPEQVIARIGEIEVTATTVRTPVGQFPLRGSRWSVTDATAVRTSIPGWAIALAIIGFFCLTFFSLLFLLARQTTMTGTVVVQVSQGRNAYTTRIPVNNHAFVQAVYAQVNYVQALAAA